MTAERDWSYIYLEDMAWIDLKSVQIGVEIKAETVCLLKVLDEIGPEVFRGNILVTWLTVNGLRRYNNPLVIAKRTGH